MTTIGTSAPLKSDLFSKLDVTGVGNSAVAKVVAKLDPAIQQQLEKPLSVLLGGGNALAVGQALHDIDQITGDSGLSSLLSQPGFSSNNVAQATPMKTPVLQAKPGKEHGFRDVNVKTQADALRYINELINHSKTHWDKKDQANLKTFVDLYNSLPGGKTVVAIRYEGKGGSAKPTVAVVQDAPQVIAARAEAKQKAVAAAQGAKVDKALDASIAGFREKFSPDILKNNIGNAAVEFLRHVPHSNSEAAQAVGNLLLQGAQVQSAFTLGVVKGVAGGAWDMVSGLAIMAGKTLQYGADTVFLGLGGAIGDLTRSAIPQSVKDFANSIGIGQVFDAVTPSLQRGRESTEALNKMGNGISDYFSSRTTGDIGSDILNAIEGKWDSLKTEFHSMDGDPVRQAEWLGEKAGRVIFEVGSTVVPITKLGLIGKVADGAADLVRLGGKAVDLGKLASVSRGALTAAREAILTTRLGSAARGKLQETLDALRKVETGGLPAAEARSLREAKASLEDALEISAPRDPLIGNPAAIAQGYGALSKGQQRLLEMLPEGIEKPIILNKSDISMTDIAALTAHTGQEFAIFTNGSRRMVLRGNETSIPLPGKLVEQLKSEGWRWSAHTQPGLEARHAIASASDQNVLKALGQEQSMILNSRGERNVFTQNDISLIQPK